MVTVDHAFDDQGRAVGIVIYRDRVAVATVPRDALPYVILKAAEVLQRK